MKKKLFLNITLFSSLILGAFPTQIIQASTAPSTTSVATTTPSDSNTDTNKIPDTPTEPITTTTSKETVQPTIDTQVTTESPIETPTDNQLVTSTKAPTSTPTADSDKSSVQTTESAPSTTTSEIPTSKETTTATTQTTSTQTITASSTSTPTQPTTIPSDTVLHFTDPLLEATVKKELQLTSDQSLTAGDIEKYQGNIFSANVRNYLAQINQTNVSDQQTIPVESLNGMQYLELLPTNTTVSFQAKIASDSKADPDLTPLKNLKFSSIDLIGNFNNNNLKKIDVDQISQLDVSKATNVAINGDMNAGYSSGVNDTQLKQLTPWLEKYATNGATSGSNSKTLQFSNSDITDFSTLKNLANGDKMVLIADTPVHIDYQTVEAVKNQPITFTAKPVLGLASDDLAQNYHFSNDVPAEYLTTNNLTNLGNNRYLLEHPNYDSNVLTYGYLGFGYGNNPQFFVNKQYGNVNLQYYIFNGRPIHWQEHPNVTVNFFTTDQKPLLYDGKNSSQILNGNLIGDSYDLADVSYVPGYQLMSDHALLIGKYTQEPQTIDLYYQLIPTSSNANDDTGYLPVYDDNNHLTNTTVNPNDLSIVSSKIVGQKTFYKLSDDKWVLADDFYAKQPIENTIRTFGETTQLVDKSGKVSDYLATNSEWRYSTIVTINGQEYYQITPTQFLLAKNAVKFTPTDTLVHLQTNTPVYNSQGELLNITLPSGSIWKSDGFAVIDGKTMYRIATDQWVELG